MKMNQLIVIQAMWIKWKGRFIGVFLAGKMREKKLNHGICGTKKRFK
jgi:hypothetical protein